MIRIFIIHSVLAIILTVAFFSLGFYDKSNLEKASLTHKPQLLFNHSKDIAKDGGSIYWDSRIYSASEQREMRVWEVDGETQVAAGFQGVLWTWKYHNLVWLLMILAGSLIGSFISYRKFLSRKSDPS
jgi:hypothetical protein